MDEIIKLTIDLIKKYEFIKELILILGAILFSITFLDTLEQSKAASRAISNYWTYVFVTAFLSGWIISVIIRELSNHTTKILLSLFVLITGTYISIKEIEDNNHIYEVLVTFDKKSNLSPRELTSISKLLKSKTFKVKISDTPVSVETESNTSITADEAFQYLLLSNKINIDEESDATYSNFFITGKNLSDYGYINLISVTGPRYTFLSVSGVREYKGTNIVKYIATSIITETITSQALSEYGDTSEPGSEDIMNGCLSDFHRTKEPYYILTQSPTLCYNEREAISDIFSEEVALEVETIFDRIRNL